MILMAKALLSGDVTSTAYFTVLIEFWDFKQVPIEVPSLNVSEFGKKIGIKFGIRDLGLEFRD